MQRLQQPATPATAPTWAMSTTRLEAFSDGVFAIAVTLLILEIKVPAPVEGADGGLAAALLHQWPSYVSYVTSFLTIGIFWANHHSLFRFIKRTDQTLLMINTLFLMAISFLPFPTALVAEYVGHAADEQVAALLYSGSFLVGGILFNAVWWYAIGKRRLIDPTTDAQLLHRFSVRGGVGMILYGVAFALGFVSVPACLLLCILLAAMYAIPGPTATGGSPDPVGALEEP
ncbi:MAG: TMEM175 family protein [Chloroflexota bacterium]|nr:TMEM175 family protein [Chloroflexota bacterium]